MEHRRSLGIMALVAGITVLGGEQALHAAQMAVRVWAADVCGCDGWIACSCGAGLSWSGGAGHQRRSAWQR